MDKSINDLMRQVERINAMIEEQGGWRKHHLHYDAQYLYQMARSIAARRGLGIFTDRDKKGKWTADMWIKREPKRPQEPKISVKPVRFASAEKKPFRPLTDEQRLAMEVKLNTVLNECEMKRVLAWIQKDMLLKMKLGLPGDPLEIPLRLMAEMREIIPQGYQAKLF